MYTYKGKNYEILKEGKAKDRFTREWYDAVFYVAQEDGNLYCKEKNEFYNNYKLVEKVPYHIQVIGKLYGLIKSVDNIATGEIRKFHLVQSQRNEHPVGRQVVSMERYDNEDYDAIWIHLGNDYFKMVGLWEHGPFSCQ